MLIIFISENPEITVRSSTIRIYSIIKIAKGILTLLLTRVLVFIG